jgi:oxepin-CoA hydrolase/3-oxo-5,6-dehydrosuberyl-CoA semialdehyde dehydrogenase
MRFSAAPAPGGSLKTLRSYVCGRWHEARTGLVPLVNPSTEEVVAQAGSDGVDFGAVLAHAREEGGPALRRMTFAERGALLKEMSKVMREHRDELLALSAQNNGTTTPDGSFDVDGGSGTLAYYAMQGKVLGDRRILAEGDGVQLAKTEAFWARHALVPRPGVAVHINAFNFPAWGFAEKAACALLAGMPVVTKPATATALVTERLVELIVAAGFLPPGALQLIAGGTGDLLDHLGGNDVLAFTGSADTALRLRSRGPVLAANVRFNVEADSLNAAIVGPDVVLGTPAGELFLKDVTREITQKAGQKCTAVRRILVPAGQLDAVQEALAARLAGIVTGNPEDPSVRMGPLATAQQLYSAEQGVAELAKTARLVLGSGRRVDGAGAPAGKGFFFAPTLLRASDARRAGAVHEREVFGPVATLLPYDGSAAAAAAIAALGGGTLVTSAYSDDAAWAAELVALGAGGTGRIYLGSEGSAAEAPGSGAALPQTLHGGPGRAGGGEELGGLVGLKLYLQRVAVQGARPLVDGIVG